MKERIPDCTTIWGAFRQIGLLAAYNLPCPDETLQVGSTLERYECPPPLNEEELSLVLQGALVPPPALYRLRFFLHQCRRNYPGGYKIWWEWERDT